MRESIDQSSGSAATLMTGSGRLTTLVGLLCKFVKIKILSKYLKRQKLNTSIKFNSIELHVCHCQHVTVTQYPLT